ncbi:Tn3 family transposase [Streptomyces griseofuscus]|uniref:Tn3 family transposase n=1 Tax=Streptomyces griseofuscus TaxID=146922 RepID=UPI0038098375
MPVELLTDEQAAKYAAYDGAPSRTELERFFFLDDADRALIEPMRRAHNRLGFAVQMTTVRFLGVFLDDPADEPGYRRQIKSRANLQEGRHSLARKIFHGRSGQLYQRYQDGMEDQTGALGLVLNALVLFNTRYMDAAVNQLRADGFDVRDEDVARLSPFVRHHVNMLGRYSFQLPDLPGGPRPRRDPDATDEE